MKSNRKPFPQAITFLVLFVINTLAPFISSLCYENLYLIPRRAGAVLFNGAGVVLITVFLLYLIRRYLRINLTAIVIAISLLAMMVEVFLLINFHTLFSSSIALVLIDTNGREASEFLTSYLNIPTCVAILSIIVLTVLGIRFRHKLSNIGFPSWCHKKCFLILASCAILLAYASYSYISLVVIKMSSRPNSLTSTERIWKFVSSILKDREDYKEFLLLMNGEPPELTENHSKVPYVVLVLGESLSKYHLNAYGYPLPTTPKQNQRIEKGETIKFNNVTTSKTITLLALREILTFYNDSCIEPWYQYHTLPAVMNQAGYKTYWLSNQDHLGTHENSTAAIISSVSVEEFTNVSHLDEELLPMLDKHLKHLSDKAFICLHLNGSHTRYNYRYSAEFDKFGIDDISKETSRTNKRTISEYDNSVLYNDYVIDEIIKRFEDKDAIVFCFPDHGEEVFDFQNVYGHGIDNVTQGMTDIPLLVWTSDSFRAEHPDIAEQITLSADKPFCTTNFIHTVMDICGIKTKDYCAEKSLLYSRRVDKNKLKNL